MSLWDAIRAAVVAIMKNRLRSFLTVLGVMIGTASVISMVSIGEGAKFKVASSFAAMGQNLLIIAPGSGSSGGAMGGVGTLPSVTWDDVRAIEELPTVRAIAPGLRATVQLVAGDQNWSTSVWGVTSSYFEVRNWKLRDGSLVTNSDVEAGAKVVVLGETVSEALFGEGVDPIGQTIRVKNIPFVVVGTVQPKGQSPMGTDYDDIAFIPISAFQSKLQGSQTTAINGLVFVAARSEQEVSKAENEVKSLLRERHRLREDEDDDFSVRNLSEIAQASQESTRAITLLLAAVAAVSLVIGGIGIMNIMLVSVTERTREIGLRIAVGAEPLDIRVQFLIEAVALSVFGGLIGVGLGIGAGLKLSQMFEWPLLLRVDIIGWALLTSVVTGIVFGFYPAFRASNLNPIEALRHE